MYDEQVQANKAKTNKLRDELICGMNSASELATVYYYTRRSITGGSQSTPPGDKVGVSLRQQNDIAVIDIFDEKKKKELKSSMLFYLILLIFTLCCKLYIWVLSKDLFVIEKWV